LNEQRIIPPMKLEQIEGAEIMKRSVVFILLGCALIAGGCSSFQREYVAAKPIAPNSISGPWEGEWVSKGGHRGELRCILTETSPAGGKRVAYEARFEAKFWGIFTAHYSTPLAGTTDNGVTALSGDHDLGGLGGGKYHYEAKVTPTKFDATYRSEADEGEFHMSRPGK
jgi:hypothetical protein